MPHRRTTIALLLLAALSGLAGVPRAQEPTPQQDRKLRLQGRASIDRRTHVAGVVVLARLENDPSRIFVSTTDGAGDFRFEGLPEGDYTVRFERSGFDPVVKERVQLKFPFRAVVEVTMVRAADPVADAVDYPESEEEPAMLAVRGLLVHRDGNEPVAEARVRFVHPEGAQNPRFLLTDAKGRFEIDDLPAGPWEMQIDAVGFIGVTVALDLAQDTRIGLGLVKQPASYQPTPFELMPPERLEPPEGFGAVRTAR